MATIAVTGRFDLGDTQWAVLEPLLPKPTMVGASAEVEQAAAH